MSKPTYHDIARRASVGAATVERVLNGRGGVRPDTALKVILAAQALDWPGRLPERHRGIVRLEVILVRPETNFYARLASAFRRIASTLDSSVQVQVTFVDENNAGSIAGHIADKSIRRSALIISTPNDLLIRRALTGVHDAGMPIIQLVNRNISGGEFVGIDNYVAGRVAGMMIHLAAKPGHVIGIRHRLPHQGHSDRLRGFSDYFHEHPRDDLRFDFVAFGQDDRTIGAERVLECLSRWPDLSGIYSAGGGNVGILDAFPSPAHEVRMEARAREEFLARADKLWTRT